jgi:RNA polymerase sigma factor (TIGR02999 family)
LFPFYYAELRQLAARYLHKENVGHTLQPTALVHETYVKLVEGSLVDLEDKTHFFAVAANIMRQILIDHARAKKTNKRGGDAVRVYIDDRMDLSVEADMALLAIDEALSDLEKTMQSCRASVFRRF